MRQIVSEFVIESTNIDEDALTLLDPIMTAETLALEKAKAVRGTYDNPIIIGCDTVVAMDGAQFTKPVDFEDAVRILTALRGRTHQVITGVAVLCSTASVVGHCVTNVKFNDVSDQEILAYVETGEPMDKAGAYGAQGMGHFLVKELDGPFDNVVGLPLLLTRDLLVQIGLDLSSN